MSTSKLKIPKILIGKAGLDGHDRGVKVVARALRDAGFEVVYTGVHLTPEMIVSSAIEEDVDAIGVSMLSGAHMYVFERIFEILKQHKVDDISVFGGGVIPKEDVKKLYDIGVKKIFLPGAPLEDIISWINDNIDQRN